VRRYDFLRAIILSQEKNVVQDAVAAEDEDEAQEHIHAECAS
jgi:hypothetical protein